MLFSVLVVVGLVGIVPVTGYSIDKITEKTENKYVELSKEQTFYNMIENLIKEGAVIHKEKENTVIIKQKGVPIRIHISNSIHGIAVYITHPFIDQILRLYKKNDVIDFYGRNQIIKQHAQLCEAGYEKIYEECVQLHNQAFGTLFSHFKRIEKQLELHKTTTKEHNIETISSGDVKLQYAKSNNMITYHLVEDETVLWEYQIFAYGEVKKEVQFWENYTEEKIQLFQEEVECIKQIIQRKVKQQTPNIIQKINELKERSKGNEREKEIQKEIDSLQNIFLSLSKQKQQEKEKEILSLLHVIEEKEKIHLNE